MSEDPEERRLTEPTEKELAEVKRYEDLLDAAHAITATNRWVNAKPREGEITNDVLFKALSRVFDRLCAMEEKLEETTRMIRALRNRG